MEEVPDTSRSRSLPGWNTGYVRLLEVQQKRVGEWSVEFLS